MINVGLVGDESLVETSLKAVIAKNKTKPLNTVAFPWKQNNVQWMKQNMKRKADVVEMKNISHTKIK